MINIKKLLRFFYLTFGIYPLFVLADNFTTEIRTGYFYPISPAFRDIYRNGGVEFELEETFRVYKDLNLWFNFNYFQREGHSLGFNDKTSIHMYPLSLGIKYNFSLMHNLYFYLGIGASYTCLTIHDHSSFVKEHTFKQGFGGVGKSGFLYYFKRRFFIDLFADYYYTQVSGIHRARVQGTSRNVGGLRTGLGFGVSY